MLNNETRICAGALSINGNQANSSRLFFGVLNRPKSVAGGSALIGVYKSRMHLTIYISLAPIELELSPQTSLPPPLGQSISYGHHERQHYCHDGCHLNPR